MRLRMILFAASMLYANAAFAQQAPSSYVLSSGLVDEIFKNLTRQPYADVVQIISKIQAEVQHQAVAPTPAPGHETPPMKK